MNKLEIKNVFAKVLLFILCILLGMNSYYKIYGNIKVYGLEPIVNKNYMDSERFEKDVKYYIELLEYRFNGTNSHKEEYNLDSVLNTTLSKWYSNIECIFEFEDETGKEYIISNITNSEEEMRKDIADFKSNSNKYYICKLNELPDTNINLLKSSGFKVNQANFKTFNAYIRINSVDKNDLILMHKEVYENFEKNGIKYMLAEVVLLVLVVICIIYLCKKLDKEKKLFFETLYNEELVLLSLLVLYIIYISTIKMLFMKETKWIICFIAYFILYNSFFNIIKKIKQKQFLNNFILGKIFKNIGNLYIYIIILILFIYIGIKYIKYIFMSTNLYYYFYTSRLINIIIFININICIKSNY